jgi:hypothetical protein
MSITNSVASAGLEASGQLTQKTDIALSGTVQQTNSVTSILPTISRLKVRFKISAGGGTSPTLTDVVIQVTDGTSTVVVFKYHPSTADTLSSTAWTEITTPVMVFDLAANEVDILTTLGGTSPTATLDWEVFATP